MKSGTVSVSWQEYRHGWNQVDAEVIEETMLTVYVNAVEIGTMMASPRDQIQLALGFLKNEGIIENLYEVREAYISKKGCCVDIWLDHPVIKPNKKIITSGCGGGFTYNDLTSIAQPVQEGIYISPTQLSRLFNKLQAPDSLYSRARGVHAAAISSGETLLAVAEDVGRHNAVDKLVGMCMLAKIETQGLILLTTGRISSEMLRKGAAMGCPIIASRNSPTSMSVEMAKTWNITLVGYVRKGTLRAYTHPERLQKTEPASLVPLAGD